MSKRDGHAYRLPTEAEWEYACRAGTTSPYFFGETISTDLANYGCSHPGRGKGHRAFARPTPVGSFQVDGVNGKRNLWMTGCHQPVEDITGPEVPFAWFAQGLRFVDISNPHAPREVASYMPDVAPGADRVCSNDVFRDHRGLVYVLDRIRGFHIVERI